MKSTRDQTPPEVAAKLANLERVAFGIERIITISLTCFWVHSYFNFFSYSKESFIFDHAASACFDVILCTNTLFLVCLFIRISLDAPPNQDPQDEDRKNLLTIERYAFYIERCGMVLQSILRLPLGLTYVQFLHISRASCIVLFPVANILYLESFILGSLKEQGDSFEIFSGGTDEIADRNHQDGGHRAEMQDDTSPLMPNVYGSATYAQERQLETPENDGISVTTGLEELGIETQEYDDILGTNSSEEFGTETKDYDDISGTTALEELGIETQGYDDNLELDDDIPDLVDVEETKEEATDEEKGTVNAHSEESFEMLNMPDNQMGGGTQELEKEITMDKEDFRKKMLSFEMLNVQVHQMRREIQVLEKQFATAKQKYLKKLKKVEDKWEKKLKKVARKYREERQIWGEQKVDLVSRLSAAASQAEFYYIESQDLEENHRKMEEEKIDLMMKLSAANASCEVYRSLLHDDLCSTLHN